MNQSAICWLLSGFRRTHQTAFFLLLNSQNLLKQPSTQIKVPKNLSRSQWLESLTLKPFISRPVSLASSRRKLFRKQSTKVRAIMARQRITLPWGLLPLRRISAQEATCAGLASPDCAAPPGFLNLLTPYSACAFSALFHAESVHGILLSEVSPSQ